MMKQKVKFTKIIGGALKVEDYIFLLKEGQQGVLREVEVEKDLAFFCFNTFQKESAIDVVYAMAKLGKYVKVKYTGRVLCENGKMRDIDVVFNNALISLTKKYFNENDYILDISFSSFGRENNFGEIDISHPYAGYWGDDFFRKESLPL